MTLENILVFSKGLIFGFGLIIAIGAQNVFVLRHGIKKSHVFATAFVSALGDTILIILGVGGLGTLIANSPLLTSISVWGGGLFVFFFGLKSFLDVNKIQDGAALENNQLTSSLSKTILAALAFSFLNPHVYIDTVVLIGSLGAQYPINQRWIFASGTIVSSWIWFFSLAYGAAFISPIFDKPKTSKILNILIGIIMWIVAYSLLMPAILNLF